MALNPIVFTEKVVRSFLRYQLTAYPFADERLHAQMRRLLSLDRTRHSPLLQEPYISLSRRSRWQPERLAILRTCRTAIGSGWRLTPIGGCGPECSLRRWWADGQALRERKGCS